MSHVMSITALRPVGPLASWDNRTLYACPQEVKDTAYKGLMRPVLEYSATDPSGVGLQDGLEKVQTRAIDS